MKTRATLYTHATIITVDRERSIWLDAALLIVADRIVAIDKTEHLRSSSQLPPDTTIVDCSNRIILPGLINTHAHLAQSLLRGLAEDVPLHSWLCDSIWPLEANYDQDDGYIAARLTIAEMLRSGTTCFLEAMLTHRSGIDNVVKAVSETGIRACLGKLVKVEETNKQTGMVDARDRDVSSMSIEAALAAHARYHGSAGGRVHIWIAAGTPRGSAQAAHKAIGDTCAQHGMALTMHCAEAPKDLTIYRESYNCSPVEFCKATNLIGKGRTTVLAHMVNLDLAKDLPILFETGAAVAHNPACNCKLASGIAPIPEIVQAGVNVGLGTDGAPSNNTYDMLQEMRFAALLHKGTRGDASLMRAEDVLAMATINGARALGLEKDIGSIEVGKKADFIILDPTDLHAAPFDPEQILTGGLDPVTTVVYSCTGADVETVVIDGRIVVQNRKLVSGDENLIQVTARNAIRQIRLRSGVGLRIKRAYR